jgi:hypothetical protein
MGLGRRLVALLAERACVARFSGTMMASNRGAVRLMRGFGTHVDRDVIEAGMREIIVQVPSSALVAAPMH